MSNFFLGECRKSPSLLLILLKKSYNQTKNFDIYKIFNRRFDGRLSICNLFWQWHYGSKGQWYIETRKKFKSKVRHMSKILYVFSEETTQYLQI